MSTNTKKSKSSEETLEKLRAFINEKGGIVKKEEFAALDVDYRKILEFVEAGTLVRIKNGYYTDRIDRFSEEELIARLFPDARLCMESALYAYGYIREKPYGWHLAVDKNTSKSRFKMDYPKVIPYYTEPEALELGSTTIEQNGLTFLIYDKERMICDCLKYEAKLDRAIFREAVQSYIRDNDKVAIRKRPEKGLLAGLYELPNVEGRYSQDEIVHLVKDMHLSPIRVQKLENAKHIFSHIEWQMEGYAVLVEEAGFDTEAEKMAENHLIFVDAEKSQENYAIPSAFAAYAKYMGIRLGNEKFLETD